MSTEAKAVVDIAKLVAECAVEADINNAIPGCALALVAMAERLRRPDVPVEALVGGAILLAAVMRYGRERAGRMLENLGEALAEKGKEMANASAH